MNSTSPKFLNCQAHVPSPVPIALGLNIVERQVMSLSTTSLVNRRDQEMSLNLLNIFEFKMRISELFYPCSS